MAPCGTFMPSSGWKRDEDQRRNYLRNNCKVPRFVILIATVRNLQVSFRSGGLRMVRLSDNQEWGDTKPHRLPIYDDKTEPVKAVENVPQNDSSGISETTRTVSPEAL